MLSLFLVYCFGLIAQNAANSVVELTEDTFDTETKDGTWLVKFYAPWCGHCKKLAPTFDELAQESGLNGAKIAKVDCTVHKNICSKMGIRGYPTLKAFDQGVYHDFSGARSLSGLKTFITSSFDKSLGHVPANVDTQAIQKEDMEPPKDDYTDETNEITLTKSNFNALVDADNANGWFLKFYAPWCGHCKNIAPTWMKLSNALKESVKVGSIDCTVHRSICTRFDVKGYPTLIFVKDNQVYAYKGKRSLDALTTFALSGYKENTPLESGYPEAPSPFALSFTSLPALVDAAVELSASHPLYVFGGAFLLLITLAMLLVKLLDCCMGVNSSKSVDAKKKDTKKKD